MARRLRYQVAVSLDGFIARTDGSADWIVMDPAIDFQAMFRQFDAAVMGRKTYDAVVALGADWLPANAVVFSRNPAAARPGVRMTADDPVTVVRELKAEAGQDIWLYGGGELFRTLAAAGLVDTVELAVIPVLLGDGIRLAPGIELALTLTAHRVLPGSGIVALAYAVPGGVGPAPDISYVRG